MLLVMKALPSHSNVATICLAVVVLLLVDLEVFNGVSLPEQCQLYEQKILPMSRKYCLGVHLDSKLLVPVCVLLAEYAV